jgi:ABC-type nitrate/sulfonate/bicarbonate transport system substrate-binding protein
MHATSPASRTLRLGFIPLTDAAPLLVAAHEGLFRRHGLTVTLHREAGWATVRDKILFRELDGGHAPGALPLAATLGLGCHPVPSATAFVLGSGGNALTLSTALRTRGVRDAATFAAEVARIRHDRCLVLGVVSAHSSHRILLGDWLRGAGLTEGRGVRIVVVPPPQLVANLAAGTIDGFCGGEPWNTLAVRRRVGWVIATSDTMAPGHPEKVLMVRADFAAHQRDRHLALTAALSDAANRCADPGYTPRLVSLLARREHLNLPESVIAPGLLGPFDPGAGGTGGPAPLVRFGDPASHVPTPDKARWFLEGLARSRLLPPGTEVPASLPDDVFLEADHLNTLQNPNTHAHDART